MNKTTMSSRAMSVTNCPTSKQIKYLKTPIHNFLSPQQSTLGGSEHHIDLNNISQIFKLYFPDVVNSLPIGQINLDNYQEILHWLLKEVKNMQAKTITYLENQQHNIQMELKILRDSRDRALQKIKTLEKQLTSLREKIKGKQYDCFGKNQQIFNLKQKIQNMEKNIVVKNLQVKSAYEQLQNFKLQLQGQIEMCSNINQKYEIQNKKLKNQLRKSMLTIAQLQTQLQTSQLQKSTISHHLKNQPQTSKSYLQPLSDQNRYDTRPITRNRSCSASNTSHSAYSTFTKPEPSKQELMSQLKQLRDNQSALIDRLAQRDRVIQSLESRISGNVGL